MLNMYLLLPIMTLCVIGVYFSIKEIASLILKNRIDSCVVLEVRDNADGIENAVRNALGANPESDIVIIDKSKNEEVKAIIKYLEHDYERVHIKTE